MQLPIELELLIYKHAFYQSHAQVCQEVTALVELAGVRKGDCLQLPLCRKGWGWKRKVVDDFIFTPAYWGHYDPTVCACTGIFRGTKLFYKNSTYHYDRVPKCDAFCPEILTGDDLWSHWEVVPLHTT